MDPTRRSRVQQLFDRYRELPQTERAHLVNEAADDPAVVREVQSLLDAYDRFPSFLEEPALARHAPVLEAALLSSVDIAPGSRVGPFEIVSRIGAGGMGVVYHARDTQLRRDVALKLLPPHVATQPSRVVRFQTEARAIGALNHPNIATLYGVQDGALVMELVPGSSLQEVLGKGPLGLEVAVRIAGQIADALDAAHQRGIVHRDLKPANIKLLDSGIVKVLDFGLAKVADDLSAGAESSSAEGATEPGMIIGTAGYMSPEQAAGRPVDKRTDIWAFGVVFYEMLAGRQLFDGETNSHRLAAVLTREPDFAVVPMPARRLLKACLEKDPARRLRDIGDWSTLIDVEAVSPSVPEPARAGRRRWVIPALLAAAVLSAGAAAFVAGSRVTPAAAEMRVDLALPTTPDAVAFALSPDGARVAFVSFAQGRRRVSVRDLTSGEVITLPDTDGASSPFWSPDGRSIGFFANYRLKRIDLDGAQARELATLQGVAGDGAWGRSNVIVFAVPGAVPTLSRVDASGGPVTPATTVTQGQLHHLAPRFLPDGQHFTYVVMGTEPSLWLGALDGSSPRQIAAITPNTDSAAESLGEGWLVRVRQGVLEAQAFNAANASLEGEPVTLEKNVPVDSQTMAGGFSVAGAGPVLWRHGGGERRQLQWVTRTGEQVGTLGDVGDSTLFSPELSPDGSRVLTMRGRPGESDIWLLDGQRNSRVTLESTDERVAIWSPTGDRIVFTSNRAGSYDLYMRTVGHDGDQLLRHSPDYKRANTWSPDGRFLIYASSDGQGDLMVMPLTGTPHDPRPFVNTRFNEQQAAFSPDGRWVAYQSDEAGRFEIYLRPFPGPGPQFPVSTNGGGSARWSRNGKELFYLAPDLTLMSVSIDTSKDAPRIGAPVALFQTTINRALNKPQYDVAPDGRFLLLNDLQSDSSEPIRLLLNWRRLSRP